MNQKTLFKEIIGFNNYIPESKNVVNVISENKDLKNEIKNVLVKNYGGDDFNIVAEMGAGKTDAVIEAAYESEKRIILLVPLQVIARQKFFHFEYNFNIQIIHGPRDITEPEKGIDVNEITSFIEDNSIKVIICVYNSFIKLFDVKKFDPSKFILVIDEAHTFVTQINFRFKEITYIKEQQRRFLQRVSMTGTPEGTLYNDNKTYLFKSNNKICNPQVKLIAYGNNGLFRLLNLLLISKSTESKVVLIDNLSKLIKLRLMLIFAGIRESEIKLFASETKKSEEFIGLELGKQIPRTVKFILTTRVLSEGASLYLSSQPSIYILDSTDLTMKRQFIKRFRRGTKEIYDLLPFNANDKSSLFNVHDKYLRLKQLYSERLSNNAELMAETQLLLSTSFNKETRKPYIEDFPYIYKSEVNSELKISEEAIANHVLSTLDKMISKNIFFSKSYYEEIAGYKVSVLDYNKIVNKNKINLNEYRNLVYKSKELRTTGSLNFIYTNLSKIITRYLEKEKRMDIFDNLSPDLIDKQISLITDIQINGLLKPKFNKYLDKLILLAIEGFDKQFLLNALDMMIFERNKKLDYLLEQINYHIQWQTILNYPVILKLAAKESGYEVYLEVYDIINQIEGKEIIVLNDFEKLFREKINTKYRQYRFSYMSFLRAIKIISKRKQKRNSSNSSQRIKHYFVELQGEQSLTNILNDANLFFYYSEVNGQELLNKLLKKRIEKIIERSNHILQKESQENHHIALLK